MANRFSDIDFNAPANSSPEVKSTSTSQANRFADINYDELHKNNSTEPYVKPNGGYENEFEKDSPKSYAFGKGLVQRFTERGQELAKSAPDLTQTIAPMLPGGGIIAKAAASEMRNSEYYRTLPREIDKQRQMYASSLRENQKEAAKWGSRAADASLIVGSMAIPGGTMASRLAGTIGSTAGLSVTNPDDPSSTNEKLTKGIIGGAIGGAAGEGLGYVAGKGLSKLGSKIAGNMDEAEKYGIKLTAGQAAEKPGLKNVEAGLSKITGLKGTAQKQLKQSENAVYQFVYDVTGAPVSAARKEGINLGKDTANYASLDALRKFADSQRTIRDNSYKLVEKQVEGLTSKVPIKNFKTAIQNEALDIQRSTGTARGEEGNKVLDIINKYQGTISNKKEISPAQLIAERRDLSNLLGTYKKNSQEYLHVNRLIKGIDGDMKEFAQVSTDTGGTEAADFVKSFASFNQQHRNLVLLSKLRNMVVGARNEEGNVIATKFVQNTRKAIENGRITPSKETEETFKGFEKVVQNIAPMLKNAKSGEHKTIIDSLGSQLTTGRALTGIALVANPMATVAVLTPLYVMSKALLSPKTAKMMAGLANETDKGVIAKTVGNITKAAAPEALEDLRIDVDAPKKKSKQQNPRQDRGNNENQGR